MNPVLNEDLAVLRLDYELRREGSIIEDIVITCSYSEGPYHVLGSYLFCQTPEHCCLNESPWSLQQAGGTFLPL